MHWKGRYAATFTSGAAGAQQVENARLLLESIGVASKRLKYHVEIKPAAFMPQQVKMIDQMTTCRSSPLR